MSAVAIDQFGFIDQRFEAFSILAHEGEFETFLRRQSGEHGLVHGTGFVHVFRCPVGHGRVVVDQFAGTETGHLAEGRVDVNDPSFEIAGAHADRERVFHGGAKSVFGAQGGFGTGALLHQAAHQPQAGKYPQSQKQDGNGEHVLQRALGTWVVADFQA